MEVTNPSVGSVTSQCNGNQHLLPCDWQVRSLTDLVEFLDGMRRPVKEIDRASMRGEIPYYGASGIVDYVDKYLFDEELVLLSEDGENIISRSLPLAFRITGKAWVNNHAHVLRPKAYVDARFLTAYLESLNYERFNSGTAQPKLNKLTVANLAINLPKSHQEQSRIADALTDADALIDSLEQLLTKKRQIKQGAMQELLTGKRRLRHVADWHDLRLGDAASLKARIGWQGLTTAEYKERGDHLLVTGTEFFGGRICWDACHCVDQDRYDQDRNIQLAPGDVLVTKDGTIGKAALIDTLPMPATLNSGVFVIRPRNQAFHPGFFYYLLASTVFSSFLGQLSAGSTINHLYQKDFVHFKFRAPQDIEEQRAVFEVLKAIDSEIEALESRLTKARALKQAMAQALLTGKIRLI